MFKCDESDTLECDSNTIASFKCGDNNNGVPDETDLINITNTKFHRLKNLSRREQMIRRIREQSAINDSYNTSDAIRNSHIKPGEKCTPNPHGMSLGI